MAKPIVNGIEKDVRGQAQVIRLNMLSRFGKEIAGRFNVKAVPMTIILDAAGNPVFEHAGLPDRKRTVERLRGL